MTKLEEQVASYVRRQVINISIVKVKPGAHDAIFVDRRNHCVCGINLIMSDKNRPTKANKNCVVCAWL